MLNVLSMHAHAHKIKTTKGHTRLEVMDMIIILIVMIATQVYVQTHQIVSVNYMQFFV